MELRRYWLILMNRLPIVLGTFVVAFVVAAASVYLAPASVSTFDAQVSIADRPQPIEAASSFYSDDYYSYVASEYANDDLISILESDTFMQAVRARLQSATGGAPAGSIVAKKAHRVVQIDVSSSTTDGAIALAKTVAAILTDASAQSTYFSLFTNRTETVTVVDGPRLIPQAVGRSAPINLAVRALVGLVAGLGLAFLVEYLDDTLRPDDVESVLGWRVVGEIPGPGVPRLEKRAKLA